MSKPKDSYVLIFENRYFICECEAIPQEDGTIIYDNILITDKESNVSREALELPESLMAVAKAVAEASIEEE